MKHYIEFDMFTARGEHFSKTNTERVYTVRGAMATLRRRGYIPLQEIFPDKCKPCKLPRVWVYLGESGASINAHIH